jgi:eukaryotic-like serine/threonine-protein kinase
MRPERRIAGRFELDRAAGAGGMATVYLTRDVETGARVAVKVLRGASRAGNVRGACNQRVGTGYACNELGAYAEAAVVLRAALADAERMGLSTVALVAEHNLGLSLAQLGALDEARVVEAEAAEGAAQRGIPRIEGGARIYLAAILADAGDLDAAAAEALDHARSAAEILASLGIIEEGESLVRLAHAEALEANGDHDAAVIAAVSAQQRLMERAEKIEDPALRASFLDRVPEHARTLALAHAWVDAQSAPPGPA